ncbi:hypothetical protein PRUPE_8G132100 [Prunus persica]|uniref:Disease resistance protein RPM1-like n=1 Tax=Prunus persica TaxID=3760 RepID=A0A251MX81_PRUPE|nr:hypothetical protein PRUPE_8G132100 [Prunus persica]
MAETAVNSVIDKLVALLRDEGNLLIGIHDEVTSIKDILESMMSFLKDADAQAERANLSSSVKTWVMQTRQMASHIEDVIDDYLHLVAYRGNKRGLGGFLRKSTHLVMGLFARHEIASEIQRIKKRVLEIRATSAAYGFNSTQQISFSSSMRDDMIFDPRMASLYTEEAELVGIQTLRDELIAWLIDGEVASRRSVISVVGMGGLGKTTLAKKVYDNPRFVEWFPWRAWIPVSQSNKNDDTLRGILTELHRTVNKTLPEGIKTMDWRLLIDTLRGFLKEKRYAIVFDDVWSINFWECLKLALPDNNNGSRIIITTRISEVAASCREALYHLEPLSQALAWQLFCKKTFQDSEGRCPPELKQFAITIVNKCGGLPLAIVAISGLLSTRCGDVYQWRKLHDSLGSELEFNPHLTNVTKILSFSYHDLPPQLKPCFLYFGTYPNNCTIRCATLIRKWIAEGFIKEQRDKTLEEVAEEYLTELIQRSLVQVSYVDDRGMRRECQVHDVMREAVILLKIGNLSFSQFLQEDSTFNSNMRHLSVGRNAYNVFGGIKNSRAHSLCFFHGIGGPENPFTCCRNLYKRFKFLRLLDFEDSPLDNLPDEVGYLYHLRYLSLRKTSVKILPKSIGKLVNLETLDLKLSLVHEIRNEITKLPKLRNFLAYTKINKRKFTWTGLAKAVVIQEGIKGWGNLQKLHLVEATDNVDKEIGNLRQLRRLGLDKLTTKQGKDLCASMGKLSHLKSLEVRTINGDEIIDLQCLSPPPQRLQTLILGGRLEKLPDWIAGLGFLTQLRLCGSGLVGDHGTLKVLQGLPMLLDLRIAEAFSCEELHFDGGFSKLESLMLCTNPFKFMRIHKGALPLLKSLWIQSSPQLRQVPSGICNLKNLKRLEFVDMPTHFIDGIQVQETEHRVAMAHWLTLVFGHLF